VSRKTRTPLSSFGLTVYRAVKADLNESAERNPVTTEINKVLAEAAALEREPAQPGENPSEDRAERCYLIQARFTALLVEACAPGYVGADVTTDAPTFVLVPEEDREALREASEEQHKLLAEWWRQHSGEEIIAYSLLDAMLSGVWTFAGWPPDMIDGPAGRFLKNRG
jgi:hypothetical protein